MQVHVVLGNAVDARLGANDALEDRQRAPPNVGLERLQPAANLPPRDVPVFVPMLVPMLVLDRHLHVDRQNPAAHPAPDREPVPGYRHPRQRRADGVLGHARVEQRTERHVARDAGEAVEVEVAAADFEALAHETPSRRLMSDAENAAPKPLSMLTTETPAAQEFSIPSSAAMPPKLAP